MLQLVAKAYWWFDVCYWLNLTEVGALCGVTYISNRENYRKTFLYIRKQHSNAIHTFKERCIELFNIWIVVAAIHEKIFIVFMISSLTHMLASIKSIQLLRRIDRSNLDITHGLFMKQILFITSLISTTGLIIFFLKHRLLCHDMGKYAYIQLYTQSYYSIKNLTYIVKIHWFRYIYAHK